jgi:hypothetical protein
MKKFVLGLAIILCMYSATTFANSGVIATNGNILGTSKDNESDIPEMSFEELIIMMQARQAKVDIIKKNNIEIETLKSELKQNIIKAAGKINNLKIEVTSDKVVITDETINELKELSQFLEEAKNALEDDVEKITKEIEDILDLISTRGMQLTQYDQLIEKQNIVIVKMKSIMEMVNKI